MDAIFSAVADVLQLIVQPCYALTGNWWISILLFTLITKVVLLPMSLWVQKNSIVMVNVMPEINRIKVKYYGDREAIGEKQQAVFKEKHYHPLLSMVPLLVQVIICSVWLMLSIPLPIMVLRARNFWAWCRLPMAGCPGLCRCLLGFRL